MHAVSNSEVIQGIAIMVSGFIAEAKRDVPKHNTTKQFHNLITTAYLFDHFVGKLMSLEISNGLVYNPSISGASKSLILFSADFKYIIKVVRRCEFEVLLKNATIFTAYSQSHKGTLLPEYYGAFTLSLPKSATLYVVLMKNVLKGNYSRIFDLKGGYRIKKRDDNLLTDPDWDVSSMMVPQKEALIEAVKEDTAFLETLGLIDYSLIIAKNPTSQYDNYKLYINGEIKPFVYDGETSEYSIGIVDTLTEYTWSKFFERIYYMFCCSFNMSATDPKTYRDRLIDMLDHSEEANL